MCVTKYTVDQLYAIPLLLAFAAPVWNEFKRASRGVRTAFLALFVLPPLLWLGKNVLFYGNPLEPFFTWLFARNRPSAMLWERFYVASHYPQPPWSTSYWTTLLPRLNALSWLLLAPLAGIPLIWHRRNVQRIVWILVASYCLWNSIRYSQDRFLLASVALIVLLDIVILEQLPSVLGRVAGSLALVFSALTGILPHSFRVAGGDEFLYFVNFSAIAPAQNLNHRHAFYRKNLGALGELIDEANRSLPRNACILLVYEARPYLLKHDKIVYNTVFDDSQFLRWIEGVRSADEITTRLTAAGITHVLVNVEELRRFIDQYARPEQLRWRKITDVMREFPLIQNPEDLYPPFYLSSRWKDVRSHVIPWLRQLEQRATLRRGHPAAPIFLAPLQTSENSENKRH